MFINLKCNKMMKYFTGVIIKLFNHLAIMHMIFRWPKLVSMVILILIGHPMAVD